MNSPVHRLKDVLLNAVQDAGKILLSQYGGKIESTRKENQSSVVTELDVAAEKCVIQHIQNTFPDHSIIAEESGYQKHASRYTWVIDPLDGTSNYVAGLPWFGVQVAILEDAAPIMAAMRLPVMELSYFSARGEGVFRGSARVAVTEETELSNLLIACGMDKTEDEAQSKRGAEIFRQLANRARNIRATNSLVDFCYTIDGRLGACVNFNTKIWDIAPAWLMLREADGLLTDLAGQEIQFVLDAGCCDRSYAIVGASRALSAQIIGVIQGVARGKV